MKLVDSDATADEGTEEGVVRELMSMSGLGGRVLFVAVDIPLPGLRGPTSDDKGASSSDEASESESEVSLFATARFGAATCD